MWSGGACSTKVWEDLGLIPTQGGIYLEAFISFLSDNGLQSLFLQHYVTCNIRCCVKKTDKKVNKRIVNDFAT